MVANSLQSLQSEWEKQQTKKTPAEVVAFLVSGGYAPFRRLSQDMGIIIWVRKVYARTLHVYPAEKYAMLDAAVKGGVRYYGLTDDSGVEYDEGSTIRHLVNFLDTTPNDVLPLPIDKDLLVLAKNFVMLVENSVVCDRDGCVEQSFLRGLGGMVK